MLPANTSEQMRASLRELFLGVLSECAIPATFPRHVQYQAGVLRVRDDLYPLADYERVSVISIGKAAHSMLDALVAQIGESARGIVAGVADPVSQHRNFRYFTGGHPLPTAESLRAGRALLASFENQPEHSLIIYLLSGGGSAVVESPIDDQFTLDDIVATYRALVLSGAPIAEINAIRKHLSAIKGGRLAQAAAPARQVSIMVSDVPEGKLDSLASGPTMPDTSTVADCYRIAAEYGMLKQFPPAVRRLFQQRALRETPKSDAPAFVRSRWWPILSNATAQEAAARKAAELGFAVEVDNSCDDWDYARAADHLLGRMRELRRDVSRVCLISGGEVTVKVSGDGVGGRNQQFALYCAEKIAGESLAVVSAGTDGIDGNSPAAGAVVDGTTLERARMLGLDCSGELARFNAYPLLERLGDVITTGATGNNIRDLRVLLAW